MIERRQPDLPLDRQEVGRLAIAVLTAYLRTTVTGDESTADEDMETVWELVHQAAPMEHGPEMLAISLAKFGQLAVMELAAASEAVAALSAAVQFYDPTAFDGEVMAATSAQEWMTSLALSLETDR